MDNKVIVLRVIVNKTLDKIIEYVMRVQRIKIKKGVICFDKIQLYYSIYFYYLIINFKIFR